MRWEVLILLFIFIPMTIFLITRIADNKKEKRDMRFWFFTIILSVLILISAIAPNLNTHFEKKDNEKKILQTITNEVGNNLEILYKWRVSINRNFALMQSFSLLTYENSIFNSLTDKILVNNLESIYKQLKDLDLRLDNFRKGIAFVSGDEKRRTKNNLDILAHKHNEILSDLRQKGFNAENKRLDIGKLHTDKEVIEIFYNEFTSLAATSDTVTLITYNGEEDKKKEKQEEFFKILVELDLQDLTNELKLWIDTKVIEELSSAEIDEEYIKELYIQFMNTILRNLDIQINNNQQEMRKISAKIENLGKKIHNMLLAIPDKSIDSYGKLLQLMRDVLFIDFKQISRMIKGNRSKDDYWKGLHDKWLAKVKNEYKETFEDKNL